MSGLSRPYLRAGVGIPAPTHRPSNGAWSRHIANKMPVSRRAKATVAMGEPRRLASCSAQALPIQPVNATVCVPGKPGQGGQDAVM